MGIKMFRLNKANMKMEEPMVEEKDIREHYKDLTESKILAEDSLKDGKNKANIKMEKLKMEESMTEEKEVKHYSDIEYCRKINLDIIKRDTKASEANIERYKNDRAKTNQLTTLVIAVAIVFTSLIGGIAGYFTITAKVAIEQGYSQQTLPGINGVYWIKNGEIKK